MPISDEEIQSHLSDENTPAPLREAYEALKGQLESERASRTQIEREAAFLKAGLADLPHRALFEKTYEGEMNAEAIKEAAKEYGLVPDPTATTTPTDTNRADLDAIRRTQQASAGAAPEAPMDFGDALDRARSPQEWEAIMAQAPPESGIRLKGTVGGSRLI